MSTAVLDQEVLVDYVRAVEERLPRLVADPGIRAEIRSQALGMLARAHERLGAAPEAVTARDDPTVGRRRAQAGVHPADSLRAADTLFATALPHFLERYAPEGAGSRATDVAVALHSGIYDAIHAASLTYMATMLDRLSDAHLEERRRVSRDLHDRASHGIGAALAGLDLALFRLSRREEVDAGRLGVARRVLGESLDDVRALASRLREAVGARTIGEALAEHLEAVTPEHRDARVVDDIGGALPGYVAEEVFLVLREALQNVARHAPEARRCVVRLHQRERSLLASVEDDGPGFDVAAAQEGATVGLRSMAERATLLGGSLDVAPLAPHGTRVSLTVPVSWV